MTDADEATDVAELQAEFPGWIFGSVWATANSRPDARRLTAQRGAILITAWDAGGLRENIRHEERRTA
jgi:hypothetical protein